jgi:SulP family sulfate permease
MLIPQSLAYAMLAGVPAHIGLAASILPLVAYALFGRSPALAVGPVAITSAMTASALAPLATPASAEWMALAALLALLSGAVLFVMGLLRLGFIANLLSHPVMGGFISGAAVLIILGQCASLVGVRVTGESALTLAWNLLGALPKSNPASLTMGLACLLGLVLTRRYAGPLLSRLGLTGIARDILSKAAPLLILVIAALLVKALHLEDEVQTVGQIPAGFSSLGLAPGAPEIWLGALSALFPSALLIAVVGFVESVSMARAIAERRPTALDPNAELRGLGAANLASGLSGAFPVTGGLSRSIVNLEGGAMTPMAGVYSAGLMLLVLLGFGQMLSSLPLTALAALVIVAVATLIDIRLVKRLLKYDRVDALSWLLALCGVLLLGVEAGILSGIAVSIAGLLWRQSRPHMAILGRIPGTEHFRNLSRHAVETRPGLLMVRIDADLFFGNWDHIQSTLLDWLHVQPSPVRRLILSMGSVSDIDSTALEGLEHFENTLQTQGIALALAELKGPLEDKLRRTGFYDRCNVFRSNQDAFLAPFSAY